MASRSRTDALLALTLLTAVPVNAEQVPQERSGAAAWFPWVGLTIGAVGWSLLHVVEAVGLAGRAPLVMGVGIVILWALLTRMLHWDGLADVADALWGGHTPERRLEIMKDSATGAFGATAIALVAMLEIGAIGAIWSAGHVLPVLVVPVFARFAATCAAWLGTPARADGLGRSVMSKPTVPDMAVTALALACAAAPLIVGFGITGAVISALGIATALSVPHLLSEPVGGVTGDIMGASVIITEAVLFAACAIVWGA